MDKNILPALSGLLKGRTPGQLVIQYTDACNAHCPQCGMRVGSGFARSTLAVAEVKKIIMTAALNNFQALSLTGGEPLLRLDEVCALLDYAGRAGITFLRTGSNGFVFRGADKPDFSERIERLADQLAATPIRNFWISIDSCDPATHEKMRGLPGVVEGIARALPIFHERGLYPSANLGLNRNLAGEERADGARLAAAGEAAFRQFYEAAFSRFYEFVISLGFTIVNVCYPMSLDSEDEDAGLKAVYEATSTSDIVAFDRRERVLLYETLSRVIPRFRSRIRIFTPLCSLKALAAQHEGRPEAAYPCRGGLDYFFIEAASGRTFPCGYRGEDDYGDFSRKKWRRAPVKDCRLCDWECFRDPSELFGPWLELRRNPAALWRRWRREPEFFRLWYRDLAYYRACAYFDGRRPPDYSRLANWGEVSA